jgi:hypothetical protein
VKVTDVCLSSPLCPDEDDVTSGSKQTARQDRVLRRSKRPALAKCLSPKCRSWVTEPTKEELQAEVEQEGDNATGKFILKPFSA